MGGSNARQRFPPNVQRIQSQLVLEHAFIFQPCGRMARATTARRLLRTAGQQHPKPHHRKLPAREFRKEEAGEKCSEESPFVVMDTSSCENTVEGRQRRPLTNLIGRTMLVTLATNRLLHTCCSLLTICGRFGCSCASFLLVHQRPPTPIQNSRSPDLPRPSRADLEPTTARGA